MPSYTFLGTPLDLISVNYNHDYTVSNCTQSFPTLQCHSKKTTNYRLIFLFFSSYNTKKLELDHLALKNTDKNNISIGVFIIETLDKWVRWLLTLLADKKKLFTGPKTWNIFTGLTDSGTDFFRIDCTRQEKRCLITTEIS